MKGVRHYSDFMERIKVDWSTGCHNWIGNKVCMGYGRLSYKGKLVLAHRLAKYLFGDITIDTLRDPKQVVMHICDNPSCIRPDHLLVGTQQENIKDRKRKKRCAKHLDNRGLDGRFIKRQV